MTDGYRYDEVCRFLDELCPVLRGEGYADLEATLLECGCLVFRGRRARLRGSAST